MNPNHNHVSPLERKIDQLIETHQPTGIPAADDLAATIPQARSDFQQQLEDRLTAQIQFASQGDEKLTARTAALSNTLRPRPYLPLTLAAAMLAVVIVGSFLLLRGGKMPDSNLALLVDATGTPTPQPTPIHMVNVLIAYQNLPRGFQFPSTAAELANIVGYTPWPESAVPFNALLEDQGGLEKLAGKILRTDVYREQPIMTNLLTNDLTQIASVGSDMAANLPADQLAISIPVKLLQGLHSKMQVGSQIDISALVTFMGGKNLHSDVMLQKIVRNAIIVHIGDFSSSASTAMPDLIMISASRDEVETLVLLVNSEIPMTVELSSMVSSVPTPDQPIPQWSDPRSVVTIPLQQIIWLVPGGVQKGDHASISAEFIFMNIKGDNTIQPMPTSDPIVIMPTPQQNPITVSKVVIEDAEIKSINSDDNTVTIAVSSQDVNTLRWLLDAKIPLALKPPISPNYLSTISPPAFTGGT